MVCAGLLALSPVVWVVVLPPQACNRSNAEAEIAAAVDFDISFIMFYCISFSFSFSNYIVWYFAAKVMFFLLIIANKMIISLRCPI